jgi:hypothetical protein
MDAWMIATMKDDIKSIGHRQQGAALPGGGEPDSSRYTPSSPSCRSGPAAKARAGLCSGSPSFDNAIPRARPGSLGDGQALQAIAESEVGRSSLRPLNEQLTSPYIIDAPPEVVRGPVFAEIRSVPCALDDAVRCSSNLKPRNALILCRGLLSHPPIGTPHCSWLLTRLGALFLLMEPTLKLHAARRNLPTVPASPPGCGFFVCASSSRRCGPNRGSAPMNTAKAASSWISMAITLYP